MPINTMIVYLSKYFICLLFSAKISSYVHRYLEFHHLLEMNKHTIKILDFHYFKNKLISAFFNVAHVRFQH